MEAASGSWLRMLVLLGLATGAWLGELLALRLSDLDLDTGVARISRSAQLVDGLVRFKVPKTTAGIRPVALGPATITALRRHRADQLELRLAFAGAYNTEADLVLAKADGRAYRPDSVSTMFRKLVDRASLPRDVRVHTLRHSAASFLAAEGVPASDIAAQLGHADGGALALRVMCTRWRRTAAAPARPSTG
jgi:integrase